MFIRMCLDTHPRVRTTLKTALPTPPVKTRSSTLMTSPRSCSTASRRWARPTSFRFRSRVSLTRNTTKMDSRRPLPHGRVGDLIWLCYPMDYFLLKLSYHRTVMRCREGAILVSCEIAGLLSSFSNRMHALSSIVAENLLCTLWSLFDAYGRLGVTYVSDVLSGKEEKNVFAQQRDAAGLVAYGPHHSTPG